MKMYSKFYYSYTELQNDEWWKLVVTLYNENTNQKASILWEVGKGYIGHWRTEFLFIPRVNVYKWNWQKNVGHKYFLECYSQREIIHK